MNKRKLLLHCCCAPCATAVIERLSGYDITLLFYNPNIRPSQEHDRRLDELRKLADVLGLPFVEIVEKEGVEAFGAIYRGREDLPEKSERCYLCYELRLKRTQKYAQENGFDLFCTTLSVSPLKNAQWINEIGKRLENEKIKFLEADFKKRDGYLRSVQLSKQYGLKRQNYCGCKKPD